MILETGLSVTPTPLYARFSRRLRGIVIDWAVSMAVIFSGVLLASVVGNSSFSRMVGLVVVTVVVLYEPILLSVYGSTLGHYFANLRVVDERSGGNIGFLTACVRIVIKTALGWLSFVILAATRRNQAVHDLLTKSTVQIRDPAKASPGQYVIERIEPVDVRLPPRWQRVAVILAYLVLLVVLYLIIMIGLMVTGITPNTCFSTSACAAVRQIFDTVAVFILLFGMAFIIARGWKGRLPGARRAR